MRMVRTCVVAGGVIAILAGLSIAVLTRPASELSEAGSIGDGAKDFQELAGRFEDLARRKGAAYAFDVLAAAEVPPRTDIHLLGHRIGKILYEQKGIDGIADCTEEFQNACSHSIVIGTFKEYGESALTRIHAACTKAPGGFHAYLMCYHGLGHGVIAHYDYDIPEMVRLCAKTGTQEYSNRESIACIGGAIMELVGGSGGHDPDTWGTARAKYFDEARPLDFCSNALIPEEAREICMTYTAPSLFQLVGIDIGNPKPELFAQAFSHCAEIPASDAKVRAACYGGLGKEFLPITGTRDVRNSVRYTDKQITQAVTWCTLANDKNGTKACVAKIIMTAFWGGENDSETAFSVCRLAPDDLHESCYTSLADEIEEYTEGEYERTLCARMPTEFRTLCAIE